MLYCLYLICPGFSQFAAENLMCQGNTVASFPAMNVAQVPLPDPLEEALRQRLLRQTFVLGRATVPTAFVAAVLTWSIFLFLNGPSSGVLLWAGVIHAVQLVRWAFMRRNERNYPESRHAEGQPDGLEYYIGPLILASFVWGLAPWFLLPAGGDALQSSIMVVILFGMLAGSIPTLSPCRVGVVAWLLPLAMLATLYFLTQGGQQGLLLAAFLLLFCAVMGKFAFVQHRLLSSGLRAQIENAILSERLLAQSRDLERLNRERSRFFASASHDLRQPVHALALYAQVLQRDLADHPSLPVVNRVNQATESVGSLLNLMLDISKIDAGAVKPVFRSLPLETLFERLLHIYESRAEAAGLDLRICLFPGEIVTDGDLLLRILSNFVDNALKFSRSGGVLISAQRRGDAIRFAVWDTGCGIALQHQAQVFEEFFQVDNPQRDASRGFGIGLSIVKRLADLLGAKLGMRSVPGRGSVFWITLPVAQSVSTVANESPVAPAIDVAMPTQPLHLLLLDDDRQICEAMRAWLQPLVGSIHVASSVAEAREIARREAVRLDALVVDFRLAERIDGIEAARQLCAVVGRLLPTILVTGDTDPKRVRAAYDSGLEVLFKPVAPRHLLQRIQALCAATQRDDPGAA